MLSGEWGSMMLSRDSRSLAVHRTSTLHRDDFFKRYNFYVIIQFVAEMINDLMITYMQAS